MKIEQRIKIERQLVRHLVRVMKLNGWGVKYIDDGGEIVKPTSEKEILETVFSVDESKICFTNGKNSHLALIVLGNDGWDAIADYSTSLEDSDGFGLTMNKVFEYCDYLEIENS